MRLRRRLEPRLEQIAVTGDDDDDLNRTATKRRSMRARAHTRHMALRPRGQQQEPDDTHGNACRVLACSANATEWNGRRGVNESINDASDVIGAETDHLRIDYTLRDDAICDLRFKAVTVSSHSGR